MTDMFSREERSRIMSLIRSRGNVATELRFIQIARKYKIRGWRRGSKLPGRPDFVWARPFSDTTFSRRRTVESPVVFALHMMLPIVIPLTIEI